MRQGIIRRVCFNSWYDISATIWYNSSLSIPDGTPKVAHEVARRAELVGLSASLLCRHLHVKIVFAKPLFVGGKTMRRFLVDGKLMRRSFAWVYRQPKNLAHGFTVNEKSLHAFSPEKNFPWAGFTVEKNFPWRIAENIHAQGRLCQIANLIVVKTARD